MPLSLEQQAMRRQGIGASEIAAVVGLNKWAKPIDVWQSKVGVDRPSNASAATERGDFLEPALRDWYAYRFDRDVTLSDTLRHKDHSIVLATPDGISRCVSGNGEPVLLEIKSPGQHTQFDWGEDGSDQIPLYYLPQVTWAMAVTGLKQAHVVALIMGDLRCFTVDYDAELFEELLFHGQAFWDKYVVKNRPPPVDDSKSYADYLVRKFGRELREAEVVETKQIAEDIAQLDRAKARFDQAEQALEKARNNIKAILGARAYGRSEVGRVSWKFNKDTTKTNWQAVAKAAGCTQALIDAHTTAVPGPRVFKFSPMQKTEGA